MPYRRRARRDANEDNLVKVMRDLGAQWLPLNVADGPDGVLGFRGRTVLVEVKTDMGRLKPGQADFHKAWTGGSIVVLRSVEDVVRLLRSER